MDKRAELGKIKSISVGMGGYQEAMFGVWLTLGGEGWGVGDGKGFWSFEPSDGAKWSREDRLDEWGKIMEWANNLCITAKVENVSDLKGVPVEVVFDGMRLDSWRILSEVL